MSINVLYCKDGFTENERFTDNGDGTITDNRTNLVWFKNANCFGAKIWEDAIIAANGLKNGDCELSDGSNTGDWRLPTINEFISLIDFSKFNPVLPAGHPFRNVQSYYYWSSSTFTNYTGFVWCVDVSYGFVNNYNKRGSRYVWPVREGFSKEGKRGEAC